MLKIFVRLEKYKYVAALNLLLSFLLSTLKMEELAALSLSKWPTMNRVFSRDTFVLLESQRKRDREEELHFPFSTEISVLI